MDWLSSPSTPTWEVVVRELLESPSPLSPLSLDDEENHPLEHTRGIIVFDCSNYQGQDSSVQESSSSMLLLNAKTNFLFRLMDPEEESSSSRVPRSRKMVVELMEQLANQHEAASSSPFVESRPVCLTRTRAQVVTSAQKNTRLTTAVHLRAVSNRIAVESSKDSTQQDTRNSTLYTWKLTLAGGIILILMYRNVRLVYVGMYTLIACTLLVYHLVHQHFHSVMGTRKDDNLLDESLDENREEEEDIVSLQVKVGSNSNWTESVLDTEDSEETESIDQAERQRNVVKQPADPRIPREAFIPHQTKHGLQDYPAQESESDLARENRLLRDLILNNMRYPQQETNPREHSIRSPPTAYLAPQHSGQDRVRQFSLPYLEKKLEPNATDALDHEASRTLEQLPVGNVPTTGVHDNGDAQNSSVEIESQEGTFSENDSLGRTDRQNSIQRVDQMDKVEKASTCLQGESPHGDRNEDVESSFVSSPPLDTNHRTAEGGTSTTEMSAFAKLPTPTDNSYFPPDLKIHLESPDNSSRKIDSTAEHIKSPTSCLGNVDSLDSSNESSTQKTAIESERKESTWKDQEDNLEAVEKEQDSYTSTLPPGTDYNSEVDVANHKEAETAFARSLIEKQGESLEFPSHDETGSVVSIPPKSTVSRKRIARLAKKHAKSEGKSKIGIPDDGTSQERNEYEIDFVATKPKVDPTLQKTEIGGDSDSEGVPVYIFSERDDNERLTMLNAVPEVAVSSCIARNARDDEYTLDCTKVQKKRNRNSRSKGHETRGNQIGKGSDRKQSNNGEHSRKRKSNPSSSGPKKRTRADKLSPSNSNIEWKAGSGVLTNSLRHNTSRASAGPGRIPWKASNEWLPFDPEFPGDENTPPSIKKPQRQSFGSIHKK